MQPPNKAHSAKMPHPRMVHSPDPLDIQAQPGRDINRGNQKTVETVLGQAASVLCTVSTQDQVNRNKSPTASAVVPDEDRLEVQLPTHRLVIRWRLPPEIAPAINILSTPASSKRGCVKWLTRAELIASL
jgi:hypothetical protein